MFYAIDIIEIFLLIRALMSWFPKIGDNRFGEFVYNFTEPFLEPFRVIINKSKALEGLPIDLAFLVAIVVLEIARSFLGSFI